ncbi:COG4223 family protein [Bradyrhizobium archetypum]|uniref:Uncharacterized protein n=1 Tax=Bradyrhizobium archetypum TaxID=2721160 RepID=A0A7Y4H8M4_9BRAD|nr:hypothetical protein [Bradyrhizobium archetypum]NOJ49580.1 hypothetical protein [Bradyrhizobium archetypum]
MVENRPENTGSLPETGRPTREPPTIDLEAVSSETKRTAEASSEPLVQPASEVANAAAEEAAAETPRVEETPAAEPPSRPVSPWIVAPVSGAVAAALVIGVGWMLGWPAIEPASVSQTAQLNAAAIDGLIARVASLEAKAGKVVADPAAAARTEVLEKSVATLRGEVATARAQSEKLASAINEARSAPRADGAVSPDLTAFAERIAKVENQMRAQSAEIAQQSSQIADTRSADAKAAADMPWRRVLAAALLDVLVRIGDPYPTALATAKSLAPNPDALKPLEQFADKGVPNAIKLSTELLTLVPKLMPAQQSPSTAGTGIVDRLQAGAAKLVKIERTDTAGNDRGAVVARITAAALRNDFNEARRELKTLPPEDRAAAQDWLDRADARDAALAASRQFAAEAMAVLAKPAE